MIRSALRSAIAWSTAGATRGSLDTTRGTDACHDARRRIGIASAGLRPIGNARPAASSPTTGSTVTVTTDCSCGSSVRSHSSVPEPVWNRSGCGVALIRVCAMPSMDSIRQPSPPVTGGRSFPARPALTSNTWAKSAATSTLSVQCCGAGEVLWTTTSSRKPPATHRRRVTMARGPPAAGSTRPTTTAVSGVGALEASTSSGASRTRTSKRERWRRSSCTTPCVGAFICPDSSLMAKVRPSTRTNCRRPIEGTDPASASNGSRMAPVWPTAR